MEIAVARAFFLTLACAAIVLTGAAASQPAGEAAQPADDHLVLSYGPDPLQTLDVWPSAAFEPELIVFVHGGGWSRGDKRMMHGSDKLRHWQGEAYAVASLNYRLVPDATVEQQARDIAAALALLKAQADELGFDAQYIALVGHSAGAHLVALIGTDERYLRGAGLSFADLSGVVLLDGAAYDVPSQLREGPRVMQRMYRQAFGADAVRQARLSPTAQAAAPNAPAFLILHVQREDGARPCRDQPPHGRRGLPGDRRPRRLPASGLRGSRPLRMNLPARRGHCLVSAGRRTSPRGPGRLGAWVR